VAVARALLADFSVLALDEPTAHLEPAAADALIADLLALTEGRSTLLITHRLAALEQVDEIAVMAEGRVVECGSHAELLAAGGRYAGLWWEERMHDRPERPRSDDSRAEDRWPGARYEKGPARPPDPDPDPDPDGPSPSYTEGSETP
jgi:ABC-type multidrug transport system ATPase subunit